MCPQAHIVKLLLEDELMRGIEIERRILSVNLVWY